MINSDVPCINNDIESLRRTVYLPVYIDPIKFNQEVNMPVTHGSVMGYIMN